MMNVAAKYLTLKWGHGVRVYNEYPSWRRFLQLQLSIAAGGNSSSCMVEFWGF